MAEAKYPWLAAVDSATASARWVKPYAIIRSTRSASP
jgi:hypothetical protein